MWIIDKFGNLVFKEVKNSRVARIMSKVHFNDEGGSGGGGGAATETIESLTAKLAAAEAASNALKSTNASILDEKKKLAATAAIVEKLGGADALAQLSEFQQKVANDEILKLASEGKHTEAIEKATERLKVTFNAEKEELLSQINSNKTELQTAQEQLRTLIIDNAVVRDFVAVKGLEAAIPDVLYRARSAFKVENGIPVARDESGALIQGAKGPLTVKEWAENLKKTAPHFFPTSAGAGISAGDNDPDNFASALLKAAEQGPTALRLEKARQAKIKAGK